MCSCGNRGNNTRNSNGIAPRQQTAIVPNTTTIQTTNFTQQPGIDAEQRRIQSLQREAIRRLRGG